MGKHAWRRYCTVSERRFECPGFSYLKGYSVSNVCQDVSGEIISECRQNLHGNSSAKSISTTVPVRHIKGFAIHPSGDTLFGFSHSGFVWVDKEFHEVKSSLAAVRIICACYLDNVLWLGGLNGLWPMKDTMQEYMGSAAGRDDNLTIVIEDNGIGREAAQHNRKDHRADRMEC